MRLLLQLDDGVCGHAQGSGACRSTTEHQLVTLLVARGTLWAAASRGDEAKSCVQKRERVENQLSETTRNDGITDAAPENHANRRKSFCRALIANYAI
jgi:hypothetical protein